jgi:hypothetical protein
LAHRTFSCTVTALRLIEQRLAWLGVGWQHTVFLRSEAVVLVVFDLALAASDDATFRGVASTVAFWLNSVYSSRCEAGPPGAAASWLGGWC